MASAVEPKLSVAICTYNGAERLPAVLDHLRMQQVESDGLWEVLVVDNRSTDGTADVVRRYQQEWVDGSVLRYVHEPRQGKTHAIVRAFQEAAGPLVGFLDDDNIPEKNWVSAAIDFARRHPKAGAFGGMILPDYEQPPPEDVRSIESAFAIVRRDYQHRYPLGGFLGRMFAPGAGLVIRKEAWTSSVPPVLRLEGPSGSSSMGLHEDMEVQWHLHRAGWEIWHNPEMAIQHKIPPRRFSEEYLTRFFRELGLSRYRFRMLILEPWQKPVMLVLYMVSDAIKYLRTFSLGRSGDLAIGTRCRREMRKYLLLSPFVRTMPGKRGGAH